MSIYRCKKCILYGLLAITHHAYTEPFPTGLIGGNTNGPYAAVVSPTGGVTPLSLGFPAGFIDTVALNDNGIGLIGGGGVPTSAYAAWVTPTLGVVPLSNLPAGGNILSVALNNRNHALLGGSSAPLSLPPLDNAFAAIATFDQGTATPIALSISAGDIFSVAINASDLGLIGGTSFLQLSPLLADFYAAFVASGIEIPIPIASGANQNVIFSVAMSDSNVGLVGGSEDGDNAFAGFVSFDAATQTGSFFPLDLPSAIASSIISSVAMDSPTIGLIGGVIEDHPYAAFVVPGSSTPMPISGLQPNGDIIAVAMNGSSMGLIGGQDFDTDIAYVAFVSPGKPATRLAGLPKGSINSVAINRFNQGLIGGQDTSDDSAYAAIVSPSGMVTRLSLNLPDAIINSVAINSFFLSQIPTVGLHGNNLRFAQYINTYAPQEAFYFVPALFDGTVAKALESAAPTRNAISFNTAIQNTFYLTTTLGTHLRDRRFARSKPISSKSIASFQEESTQEELLASRTYFKSNEQSKKRPQTHVTTSNPYTLWFEPIGALAVQKSQHQTPGFNPATAGACLAFDAQITDYTTVGGGVSYLYTHVHEKQGMGHSNINQEDLFIYASWENNNFYVDGALWGGLFQTDQTREIHIPGFHFTSSSHPDGGQLVPHAEGGYLVATHRSESKEVTWNPFAMLDWSNAWQESFKEKGNSPFNTHQKSQYGSLLRTEVGLRVSETMFFDTWNLIFLEKGSYVNTKSCGSADKVHGFLVGSPGAFTLETLTSPQNMGVVQFMITGAPVKSGRPISSIFYQGEFSPKYQSHQLNLEFAWNF